MYTVDVKRRKYNYNFTVDPEYAYIFYYLEMSEHGELNDADFDKFMSHHHTNDVVTHEQFIQYRKTMIRLESQYLFMYHALNNEGLI